MHYSICAHHANPSGGSVINGDLIQGTVSEVKYRGLLEAAPDAMVVVNEGGEIVLLNVQAEKQFGYSRDELVGQRVKNIIPEGFAERLIADGTRTPTEALAQQIGTGIELIGRLKDGSEFPIEIMLSPLESAEGILVTAAIRNISVRKTAEKHLAQMEGRYRGLLEAAPDAMVVVKPAGEIILLNVQAEKQFGYLRDELLGQQVTSIIPEGFKERVLADGTRSAAEALAQQIGMGIELYGRRKDGSEFPIEIMLSPLKSSEGVLITAAIRNITERKHLEQMLRQAQKMEAIGQLAGGVAHDFNNLLGVILGYSELLLERCDLSVAARKDIEEVQKAGVRAGLLTQQLLAFSRKQVLQPKVLNLNEVVVGAEKLLHRLIGENIELQVILSPALAQIKADSGQIEQIIMNLAVNARDAMPEGGKLTIETSIVELDQQYVDQHASTLPGAHMMLAVTDTGCGMDAKTKAHIFEPFFTTKEFGKGTGLGLAVVYGIVKQSGGSVWLYTEPGIGTTFKIYFPIVAPVIELVLPSEKAEKVDRGSQTILIVEDDEALLQVTRRSLEEVGYAILTARGPSEAILISKNHLGPIQLMVTDVIMPGMSGDQLASQLFALRPEMRVLYVSGYTDNAIIRHGVLEPGLAFLQKPFSPKMLARKVREILAESAALRQPRYPR
jgi:PAS domain S-box-containing protein